MFKPILEKIEIICSLNRVNVAFFSNEKIICIEVAHSSQV
jgi:hypothetical protein